MAILFFCITLVLIAIFLHLILLKNQVKLSQNPTVILLFIFISVLCIGLIGAYFLNKKYSFLPNGIWQNLHVIIFYVPVMLSYIITYLALEDDSPTMTIVRFVEQAKGEGRTIKQIRQIISDEALILPRIDTMFKDGWVEFRDDKYYITVKGKAFNQIFALGLKPLNITREG